jgi:lamin tail-like protein
VPDAFIGDPETNDEDGTILITVDAAAGHYTARYGTNTVRTLQIKAPVTPPPPSSASVVIESLLPNPAGADEQLEEVSLLNRGAATVAFDGWTVRDRSGLVWTLTGPLAPGQSRTVLRNSQAMSLNNAGDEIVLLDDSGTERDRFAYAESEQNVRIATSH